MTEFGLTSTGYEPARTEDYLEIIRADYERRLGELGLPSEVDWTRNAFLGNISTIMARRLAARDEVDQAILDTFDLNNAFDFQLDNWAVMAGTTREEATKSRAPVTLTSDADTTEDVFVPAGKIVEGGGDDGKAQWEIVEGVTIPKGGGTVDAIVEALVAGATTAGVDTIDKIVTPVNGWDSVTNSDVANPGQDRETNSELRRRRQLILARGGGGSLSAIRAQILRDVEVVEAAVVTENDQWTARVVAGATLQPGQIAVYVWPDTLTDSEKEDVASAIYRPGGVAAGIGTYGTDVQTIVTGGDGYGKEVNYSFATEVTVNVATTVQIETDAAGDNVRAFADVEADIQAVVEDYFTTLGVGDNVREIGILAAIEAVEGVDNADITLNGVADNVVIELNEIADLGTNTVTE